jgi:hypothetical protein
MALHVHGQVQDALPQGPARRVVVPIGGSDREFIAQEQAVLYAEALGVPVVAVNVSRSPDEVPDDLFRFIERAGQRRRVPVVRLLLAGTDPVEALLAELGPLDLVVVGSERIGDRHRLPGFVERLVHDAPGAVQIVRIGPFD